MNTKNQAHTHTHTHTEDRNMHSATEMYPIPSRAIPWYGTTSKKIFRYSLQ